MPDPILFVAGFGRCGTTMMMNMLDQGGFPVAGPRPAFEVAQMVPGRVDLDWVHAQAGKAVKWIDPLNARIRRNDLPVAPVIIHMGRDFGEMARSQVKLLGSLVTDSRNTRRAFKKDIEAKAPKLAATLNATGSVYHMTFEWVLHETEAAAQKLAGIIATEFGRVFDARTAATVPLQRSPLCAPDLSIEEAMI